MSPLNMKRKCWNIAPARHWSESMHVWEIPFQLFSFTENRDFSTFRNVCLRAKLWRMLDHDVFRTLKGVGNEIMKYVTFHSPPTLWLHDSLPSTHLSLKIAKEVLGCVYLFLLVNFILETSVSLSIGSGCQNNWSFIKYSLSTVFQNIGL